MRSVIVVAHPDDEVCWAGGLALKLKCDIICCSIPKRDPIRAVKFFDACEVLGCRGILVPYQENPPDLLKLDYLDLSKYDHIVTHNLIGEYGHQHHCQIHNHIVTRYQDKKLSWFGWGLQNTKDIELTPEEVDIKLKALQCYDHDNGIDGMPKWQALIKRYNLDLGREGHVIQG